MRGLIDEFIDKLPPVGHVYDGGRQRSPGSRGGGREGREGKGEGLRREPRSVVRLFECMPHGSNSEATSLITKVFREGINRVALVTYSEINLNGRISGDDLEDENEEHALRSKYVSVVPYTREEALRCGWGYVCLAVLESWLLVIHPTIVVLV